MASRCYIEVFDKDFHWRATADILLSLTVSRCHLRPSGGAFSIDPSDSELRDALAADGASVVVYVDDVAFLSGWVAGYGGDVVDGNPLEYEIQGHDWLLWDTAGWPVPSAPIGSQNPAYWTRRGPAETVLKDAVRENVARLGLPVQVAPDLGRGGEVDVSLRFHPLMDRMETALSLAGIGVSMYLMEDEGLVVDVYETETLPEVWDTASGVIVGGTWRLNAAEVTRVVAGTQGEGEDRALYGPEVADWEAHTLPRVREGFVDARDLGEDSDDPQADALARMREKLAEGAPKPDLSLDLDSTEEFAYGDYWNVGDIVTLAPRSDVEIEAQIDEAELTVSDEGVHVRPVIGSGSDENERTFRPLVETVRSLKMSRTAEAVR